MNILVTVSSCTDTALASILSTVRRILSLICIIAPILLIIMSAIHLVNLVKNPDEKKNFKKLINSLIATAVLFFIPTFVNAFMYMLDDSIMISSCWNEAASTSSGSNYLPIDDQKKTNVIPSSSDYEKGVPKPSESISPSSSTGEGTSTQTGGGVVKKEETNTLKVTITKVNTYYITQIWVKNAYSQLNKYDSYEYGKTLRKPGDLLSKATQDYNLSNKLIVGFNASGFYLKDTYDSASVEAYPAYDRTSVGTLVITNGKVVRNAYNHAVKTWYIAGVDSSNQMRIFEDTASKDSAAKQSWSNSVIGKIRNTFTFASPLVEGGVASSKTKSMPSPGSALNRQAFCQIDSNNFLMITGSNLTRQNLIDIMLQYKCQTGTNFDGGGSIALLYKSKNSQNIETIIGNRRALSEVGYFVE